MTENQQGEKSYWDKINDMNRADEKARKDKLKLDAEIRIGLHDHPNPSGDPVVPEPEFNDDIKSFQEPTDFESSETNLVFDIPQEPAVPMPEEPKKPIKSKTPKKPSKYEVYEAEKLSLRRDGYPDKIHD